MITDSQVHIWKVGQATRGPPTPRTAVAALALYAGHVAGPSIMSRELKEKA